MAKNLIPRDRKDNIFKSEEPKYVTAIDIGTTKIVALIGKKDNSGKIKIVGTGSVPTPEGSVKRGVVLNIVDTAKTIAEAVEIAEIESGIKFSRAFVGIAGQHIQSQTSDQSIMIDGDTYEITEEHIRQLHDNTQKLAISHGTKIIHVIPQNYTVDNESGVAKPVGMYGKQLLGNFHIVICDITASKNIEEAVIRTGIEVDALILEPIASAAAVLTDDEKEVGVALVDIGGGTTDLAIFYNGTLKHTAVIPFGGNSITSDIEKGCSILRRYAERLKVNYGFAMGEFAPKDSLAVVPGINGREPKEILLQTLSEIIQARVEEIIQSVMLEIEASGYDRKLGAGIALTGGGALLKDLPSLVKYQTGMDVKIASPRNYISTDVKKNIRNPIYSTAAGLLIRGYKVLSEQGIDFVEENKVTFEDVEAEASKQEEQEFEIDKNSQEELADSNDNSGIDKIIKIFSSLFKDE